MSSCSTISEPFSPSSSDCSSESISHLTCPAHSAQSLTHIDLGPSNPELASRLYSSLNELAIVCSDELERLHAEQAAAEEERICHYNIRLLLRAADEVREDEEQDKQSKLLKAKEDARAAHPGKHDEMLRNLLVDVALSGGKRRMSKAVRLRDGEGSK